MTVSPVPCSTLLCEVGVFVWMLPRRLAVLVLRGYRRFISPLYGDVCRYYPTCSAYALEAFERRGFVIGAGLTVWRLLRCQPFSAGGVDPVPSGRHELQQTHHAHDDGLHHRR
ncbi:membrane protein insertion efficiency factor YidD [Pseudoclavibacter sp. CFCC 11306]|uniref:membrane protein insertion efficiency factor YidD n=1 Tax=Pseudoclavibacter sp. CFCC 11306 TaxID=1564493 RepID=UPI0013014CCD|nr:membrane protein insertion efficiency factor YidD [Pseudoclavibacter sp. CFCC 11306]KAB1657419.1 membrane protein insertion efficiency factor YidD [Pseudoclavibacter sp. CFCC 11306]